MGIADEDYYAILGVEPSATKEEISRSYRKRSLAVHPDRYKGDDPEGAIEEFLTLTRAKEVLEDAKARSAFDSVIRAREAHKLKRAAESDGRKKLREDLEAREEAARQHRGPSMSEMRAKDETEKTARADLQREIERLRKSGRLDKESALKRARASPASAVSSSQQPAALPVCDGPKLSLRWAAESQFAEPSLRELLDVLGMPPEMVLAVVGRKAIVQLPSEQHAQRLRAQSVELAARGLRLGGGGATTDATTPTAAATPQQSAPSATPPEQPLPLGWKQQQAPNGRTYFYHVGTRKTQWVRPTGEQSMLPASEHERLEALTMQRLQEASKRQKIAASEATG